MPKYTWANPSPEDAFRYGRPRVSHELTPAPTLVIPVMSTAYLALTGRPLYDPRDLTFAGGADVTGVADSTAAIQAAIDAAHAAKGGTVDLSRGVFKTTDTLVVKDFVVIQGASNDRYATAANYATCIRFAPTVAGTPFMRVIPDLYPDYGDTVLRDFGVFTNSANAGDGIRLEQGRILATNVTVNGFSQPGKSCLYIEGGITSKFDSCAFRGGGDQLVLIAPQPALQTTTVNFSNCYFTAAVNGCVINNAAAVSFSDRCIWESLTGHANVIDSSSSVDFFGPYMESVAGSFIRAGYGVGAGAGAVSNVNVWGGNYSGGPLNTLDADLMDVGGPSGVVQASFYVNYVNCEKASLLRTGVSSRGTQWYGGPQNLQQISGFTTRANSTAYAKGTIFDIAGTQYVVTTAGTTAASLPGTYSRLATDIVDGTCILRGYSGFMIYGTFLHMGDWRQADNAFDYHVAVNKVTATAAGQSDTPFTSIPHSDGDAFIQLTSSGLVEGANGTSSVVTWKTGGAIQKFAKIRVNSTTYYVPLYSAPTGP